MVLPDLRNVVLNLISGMILTLSQRKMGLSNYALMHFKTMD